MFSVYYHHCLCIGLQATFYTVSLVHFKRMESRFRFNIDQQGPYRAGSEEEYKRVITLHPEDYQNVSKVAVLRVHAPWGWCIDQDLKWFEMRRSWRNMLDTTKDVCTLIFG